MIFLKTEEEIALMRAANQLVGRTLGEVAKLIKPGVTTNELTRVAEEFIRDNGAEPTFKGYPNQDDVPFPAALCTSVNEMVVHGIPNDEPLKEGDIVSVDCGTLLNGYNGDSAYTFAVGEIAPEVRELLKVTKESLYLGIEQAVAGKRLGDIGYAVQSHCESHGYEDPCVPNYGRRGYGTQLKKGMCIAIEPMITMGDRRVYMENDGWSVRTRDHKPAAHFEHTIAIYNGKAEILSTFDYIAEVLGDKEF